ncbi:MAG: hypothetical protein H8E15_07150 [Planctomycetes bacterium]|nr:hypothetical protein [Planctomycetota bacterium]
MSAKPGQVELAGSMSGPWAEWPLQPENLRQALRDFGAPESALRLHVDGGWLTVEPGQEFVAAELFSDAAPAQLLAQVLQQLHELRLNKGSEEWVSTLRVIEYEQSQKREVLIGLTSEGIQSVGRESAWCAVPEPSQWDWLRRNWIIVTLLLIAVVASLYLNRDELLRIWQDGTKIPTVVP